MQNQAHNKSLKIMFFGTSYFAIPALKYLIQNGYDISAVVTQAEKPAGRLRVTMPSPIKKAALENDILVLEPHNLKNDEEFFKHFKHLNPDLCIVAAYGKIIPSRYLEIPEHGFLNIHPSLLPKYRGPSPVQAAIINGDTETGVSVMLVDEQMDHGSVLANTKYQIPDSKSFIEINNEIWEIGAKFLIQVLSEWIAGKITPIPQDENGATYCKLLTRHDSKINWDKNVKAIYNQIRALNPEPGTWTTWNSKILNIKTANPTTSQVVGLKPGIVSIVDSEIAVTTKTCYLILKQIQLEGGKEMDAQSFLNGHPDFLGSKLE
ncbi:MAG: methionyl-tRNA formyltransferase [bacterium]|nr:methionyl-tRNA formyltransferase [bacterium]